MTKVNEGSGTTTFSVQAGGQTSSYKATNLELVLESSEEEEEEEEEGVTVTEIPGEPMR